MSIPKHFLKDVTELANNRRSTVKGVQRLLRKGPYSLYVESGAIPFDDYYFDGKYLILGALTNVIAADGCFKVENVSGKFSVTELYHVVQAKNSLDTDYLYRILTNTRAETHAEISAQTVRLSENSLQHISIPWPEASIRKAFVDFVEDSFEHIADVEKKIASEYERGIELFDEIFTKNTVTAPLSEIAKIIEGRPLDAEFREPSARIPVVSSQGIVGFTNEEGLEDRCMIVGQAGQYLLAYRMEKGAFPLMDTVGVKITNTEVSFEQLFFGLQAKKVRSRLRVIDSQVDALAMTLSDLPELEFALGSPEQRKIFEERAEAILAGIDHMEEKLAALKKKTREIIDSFISLDENILEDLAPWTPSAINEEASFRKDNENEQADTPRFSTSFSSRTQDSIHKMLKETFLDRINENPNITNFDILWEIIPLIFLRIYMTESDWQHLVEAKDQAGHVDVALDLVRAERSDLAFLQEFTSQSSILTPENRTSLINEIDGLNANEMTPALLRWLPHEREYRPDSVSRLMTSIAFSFTQDPKTLFDPVARCGEALSPILQRLPYSHALGQNKEFADSLISSLAASCELVNTNIPQITLGDTLSDSTSSTKSDLVISLLPPNEGEWTDCVVDAQDPRWVFGVPPRNKANLAWLQHAYYHRGDEGFVVLSISNAVLHESRGCEPKVRQSLIESGCVRVVVSLPGRIWQDDRAPMSLLVLGAPREDDCLTLFINALDLGTEIPIKYGSGPRTISNEVINQLSEIVESWAQDTNYENIDGLCKQASKSQILSIGDLTPWTFV